MKSLTGVLTVAVSVAMSMFTIATADDPAQEQLNPALSAQQASTPGLAARRHAELVRTGETAYGWNWLAERFDRNQDGRVTRPEFQTGAVSFERLDSTWDGVLTPDDFDWSREGQLCSRKETVFALFKSVDTDSDGRLSDQEWLAMFRKISNDKGYLNEDDLQQLIYLPKVVKARRELANFDRIESFLDHANANFAAELPEVGQMAPDFELQTPDGQSTVRLSSYRAKQPVVLIFGCFSCGNYRTYSETLEDVCARWTGQVEFLRVYVREAHPVDDHGLTSTNARAGISIVQPTTLNERCTVAGRCAAELSIDGPVVVDTIDDRVGKAYGGWPDRLYVIDRDGRVVYRGGPGPFGFNPREMEQSLVLTLVAQQADANTGPR